MQHQDDVLAIGPLLDFPTNHFRQMSGSNVFDCVVLVDDHRGVVCEARRQPRGKKRENVDCGADFHNTDLELSAYGQRSQESTVSMEKACNTGTEVTMKLMRAFELWRTGSQQKRFENS